MKSRIVINVILTLAALMSAWIWAVRWSGLFTGYMPANFTPYSLRTLPCNPWPSIDYKNYHFGFTKWQDLAKKRSLTELQKAQLVHLLSDPDAGTYAVLSYHDYPSKKCRLERLAICAAGKRLDPQNGLYPLADVMLHMDMVLASDTDAKGRTTYSLNDKKMLMDVVLPELERASQRPINYYQQTLNCNMLNTHPVISEQYQQNLTLSNFLSSDYIHSHWREFINMMEYTAPWMVSHGYTAEAKRLMEVLVPIAQRYTSSNDGDSLRLYKGGNMIQTSAKLSSRIAAALRLAREKTRFDSIASISKKQIHELVNQPFELRQAGAYAQSSNLGLQTKDQVNFQIKNTSRMVEHSLLDQLTLAISLVIWGVLIIAGLLRFWAWRCILCTDKPLVDLNMHSVYTRVLVLYTLIPLTIYSVFSQIPYVPWRQNNISIATLIEKSAMTALVVILPWIAFRYLFKKRCVKHDVGIPTRGIEILTNWLPVAAVCPLAYIIGVSHTYSDWTGVNMVAMVFCGLLFAAVLWWSTLRKRQHSVYYTSAARYMLPVWVWSILGVALVLMPALLIRECTLLQHDELGIGVAKNGQTSSYLDNQLVEQYTTKLNNLISTAK